MSHDIAVKGLCLQFEYCLRFKDSFLKAE